MSYHLLTGATGLLGRYLIKDLLLAEIPLAVLVRPTRRAAAQQRVEAVMQYWEEKLGRSLSRPVVLEGDISEPDLGLDPRSLRWVSENCDTMLHNAASLTFHSTGPEAEPWRSNVAGTRHVLDVCREAGIEHFHHVSTAYVCGLRTGRILESELDVGQTPSNDYEKSKVAAEKMVRSSDFLKSLTVFRPAIIIGDAVNGYTTTYHGFYAPLQLISTLVSTEPKNETGHIFSSGRFELEGFETKNLVPVDWVSAVMAHVVSHPEHHGATYHLTPRQPITMRLFADVLEQATGWYGVNFLGPNAKMENMTEQEQMFHDLISIYNSYWRDDPTFDSTNTQTAAPHLLCPHVDRSMLLMMAEWAKSVNFGSPRVRITEPDFDSTTHFESLVEAGAELLDDEKYIEVGLDITGHGGGQWRVQVEDGLVVGAEIGLTDCGAATFHLDVGTFATLVQGDTTTEQAVRSGAIRITGVRTDENELLDVLQQVARPRETQTASPAKTRV
jgi:thioester reductase-like protein